MRFAMFFCPARLFLEIHDTKVGSYSNALFSTGILELLGSKHISGHKLTSMSFVDLQLDAQNSYLFTYNTFIKSSTCFEHYPAHLQEVHIVIVHMQPLVSSLSAGDCLVHRLRKNQRLHIYNCNVDLLKMSRVMLETCRRF
jgi:hypothetical protein